MIFDTSFLIDLLRNTSGASTKAKELELRGERLAITTISVFEVWRGLSMETDEKILQANNLFDCLKIYSLDIASAKNGGHIARELGKEGLMIDPEDCLIAGIVRQNKEVLVTRNAKHFSRIPGLNIEEY